MMSLFRSKFEKKSGYFFRSDRCWFFLALVAQANFCTDDHATLLFRLLRACLLVFESFQDFFAILFILQNKGYQRHQLQPNLSVSFRKYIYHGAYVFKTIRQPRKCYSTVRMTRWIRSGIGEGSRTRPWIHQRLPFRRSPLVICTQSLFLGNCGSWLSTGLLETKPLSLRLSVCVCRA